MLRASVFTAVCLTCYVTWLVLQSSSLSPPKCPLHHHRRAESSLWNRPQTQLY